MCGQNVIKFQGSHDESWVEEKCAAPAVSHQLQNFHSQHRNFGTIQKLLTIIIPKCSIIKQGGYWHPPSEPEIECKDDLSTTKDASFKTDPYICKVKICCTLFEDRFEIDMLWIIVAVILNCDTRIMFIENRAQKLWANTSKDDSA